MSEKKNNESKKKLTNLNESIAKIKVELQNMKIKKTGKNTYSGYEYYELSDFLPGLNQLMQKENVNAVFNIIDDLAVLDLIKGDENLRFQLPFKSYEVPNNKDGKPMMQEIQYLGALNTYYKKYLYMNAFGITDGEIIDTIDNDELANQKTPYSFEQKGKSMTDEQIETIAKLTPQLKDHIREIYNKDPMTLTFSEADICINSLIKNGLIKSKDEQEKEKIQNEIARKNIEEAF